MAKLNNTPAACTPEIDHLAPPATPQSHEQPTWKVQKARRTIIEAACNQCRQKKSKCDGARPTCGRCAPKAIACKYEIEPGETRAGSLKTRYVALVKEHQHMLDFMETLRAAPMDDVLSAIQAIRATRQVKGQASMGAKRPPSPAPDDPSPSSIDGTHRLPKRRHGLQVPREVSSLSGTSPSCSLTVTPSLSASSSSLTTMDTPSVGHGQQSELFLNRNMFVPTGVHESDEPCHSPKHMPYKTPSKEDFTIALHAYNTSVGALYYLYSPQQISHLLDTFFAPINPSDNASLCQLCAIAALGSFYSNTADPTYIGEDYYNMAKHHLNALIQEDSLAGMKACAALAMVNIITKSTMALTFLDLGLSLAEQSGLEATFTPPDISRVQWLDSKRVWRTLVLCSGWVSSTIGVVSNQDWHSNCAALQQFDFGGDIIMSDITQTEMAKIASLKANILRTLATSNAFSPRIISSISKDLRDWHEQLPPVMCLANIRDMETPDQHKIYFVHVLYLGGLMLLQRCIMSRWFAEKMDPATRLDITTEASDCIRDGYTAARQSARLLDLLRQEGGAVKRCWMCTFQSYISGMLIIHESYQRLLYSTETQATLDESLALIDQSIEVLKFCASDDAVAHKLLRTFKPHHDTLKQVRDMHVRQLINDRNSGVLSSIHIADLPMLRNAVDQLLVLICRPFGDLPVSTSGSEGTKDNYLWRQQKSLSEMAFGTFLNWQWDVVRENADEGRYRLGTSSTSADIAPCSDISSERKLAPTNRFLDSNRPSGWSTDTWGNIRLHETRTPIP